jgi:basic membrane lipoprotein Med (substrate-binding protein (PBP1-ABC) superfamily)
MTIEDVVNDPFSPGTIRYGLTENSVALAPFHEAEPATSEEIKAHVEMIRRGITNGWIDIDGPCPSIIFPYVTYLPFSIRQTAP